MTASTYRGSAGTALLPSSSRPASRYRGLRCTSVSRDGHRCEREEGHSAIVRSATSLHRADVVGGPHVWG